MNFTEEDLSEIESQLACPAGDKGIQMAEQMNRSNIGMIRKSIELLDLSNDELVLELGPGNCVHLSEILIKADNLGYFGLEISPTMLNEALRRHGEQFSPGKIEFQLYDGINLPYKENKFHKVMTVNTIYFWKNPETHLNQIYKVLKEGGLCAIAFAKKSFMKDLPFVNAKFTLYDVEEFKNLVQASSFKTFKIHDFTEEVMGKDQQMVKRAYSVVLLKKNK